MITILMPIFNGIEFIKESVDSILKQTFHRWELLIGINGHQENSNVFKIAKQYENEKIKVFDFFNFKNKSETLNNLVKYSKFNKISLLDVDDIWLPEKLKIQSKYMYQYDIVGSKCIYFGEKNDCPDIPVHDLSNFNFFSLNPIINSSAIITKKYCHWEKLDLEDYDLWLRLKKMNLKFYNCEEILVKHRIHRNSAFNSQGNHLQIENLIKMHQF